MTSWSLSQHSRSAAVTDLSGSMGSVLVSRGCLIVPPPPLSELPFTQAINTYHCSIQLCIPGL